MTISSLLFDILGILSGLSHVLIANLSGMSELFSIQAVPCPEESCPGSMYTAVAASWANIGYMTHSFLLDQINNTTFGVWAAIIWVCAVIGALISVALNSPPRNYIWFLLGPAFFSFLVGTTDTVKGVSWRVASVDRDMTDVWRDAETGLANARPEGKPSSVNKYGNKNEYKVAMPLIFLDGLFSTTTNALVEFTGINLANGKGGADTNLAAPDGDPEGSWDIISMTKWGHLNKIVGANFASPEMRDAFMTFFSTVCGQKLMAAVDQGALIAASRTRAYNLEDGGVFGGRQGVFNYSEISQVFAGTPLSAPMSLSALWSSKKDADGDFRRFEDQLGQDALPENKAYAKTLCDEYLFTLVQGVRWEAGHTYHQLLRGAPNGLTKNQFLKTLFYGWNIRRTPEASWASDDQLEAFIKQLAALYIFRNESRFIPPQGERVNDFSATDKTIQYGQTYTATAGATTKYSELYTWAMLMPKIQGVLVCLIIAAYPFAAMLMVVPGKWKTFFTWIAFFAWIKLWDVGIAMVQVIERSMWAMVGNKDAVGQLTNNLLWNAESSGGIGVSCSGGSATTDKLKELCDVPMVCHVQSLNGSCAGSATKQTFEDAMRYLDTWLTLSPGASLDVDSAYYLYIMSALYFAIPAVTGQLVLGAKAGAASMVGGMMDGAKGDSGRGAQTGLQGDAANRIASGSASMNQAAKIAAGKGLMTQAMGLENDQLKAGLEEARLGLNQEGKTTAAKMQTLGGEAVKGLSALNRDGVGGLTSPVLDGLSSIGGLIGLGGGGGGGGRTGRGGVGGLIPGLDTLKKAANAVTFLDSAKGFKEAILPALNAERAALESGFETSADKAKIGQFNQAARMHQGRLKQAADYESEMGRWGLQNRVATAGAGNAAVLGGNLRTDNKDMNLGNIALGGGMGEDLGYRGVEGGYAGSFIGGGWSNGEWLTGDSNNAFVNPVSALGTEKTNGLFSGYTDSSGEHHPGIIGAKGKTADLEKDLVLKNTKTEDNARAVLEVVDPAIVKVQGTVNQIDDDATKAAAQELLNGFKAIIRPAGSGP